MAWVRMTEVSQTPLYASRGSLRDSALVDSLGGNLYWSTGLSLISDIPRKPHWPVKAHLFVNAGRLDNVDKCMPPTMLRLSVVTHPPPLYHSASVARQRYN